MNVYELTKKEPFGATIVASTIAGTQKQAMRRLYRGAGLTENAARTQGYAVQFKAPAKAAKHASA